MIENIFQSINNDNVSYWLGFLAADGSVNKYKYQLSVGLSNKDREHLDKFKNFLDTSNSITVRDTLCKNNGKRYPSCYLSVYSKQLCDNLAQYGIIPNKTHTTIDFLSYIPEQYKMSFILGYFDGDGFFTFTDKSLAFGFCGNKNLITSIHNYLYDYFTWSNHVEIHNYSRSKITYYVQYAKQSDVLDFVKIYLSYENRCDLLERKFLIARDIENFLIHKFADQVKKEEKIRIKAAHRIEKICPICQKIFYPTHSDYIYCGQECAHVAQRRVERPSREELKILIREKSFLEIGKIYGVSDNAIRKWCVSYNLPKKKTIIKSISNTDWELI